MRVLAVLQFFVWLFALAFVALAVLCQWLLSRVGDHLPAGAAGAFHLAVIAAVVLRRGRRASDAIAP